MRRGAGENVKDKKRLGHKTDQKDESEGERGYQKGGKREGSGRRV